MKHDTSTNKQSSSLSRRTFLRGAAVAGAFTVVPRHVLGGPGFKAPSEKLNVALIGVGGRGSNHVDNIIRDRPRDGKKRKRPAGYFPLNENIVAMADVDYKRAKHQFSRHPKVPKYRDFRKLFDKHHKEIDAVVVATPDHNHAVIAMAAIKMGKHVYCEKPLTHSIYEARMLTEAARKAGVMTQMGNQGHSGEGIRLVCEWIWAGAIGPVREVHCWTNRPIWPQGIKRPNDKPPVPDTLSWDLWLGPAKERPYNPAYLPFNWRGWWDFGTGALGDMACHIVDPVFEALRLKYPTYVEASSTRVFKESAPLASAIHFKFPERSQYKGLAMPELKLHWYDGGIMPERPAELETGRRMGDGDGGVLFVGDKGKIICGCYGKSPRLIPETAMKAFKRPPKTLVRSPGHMQEWVRACKEGKPAGSNFDYAGPLTEAILLGNLAIRSGKALLWDGENMNVTNEKSANEFVHTKYRKGWSL